RLQGSYGAMEVVGGEWRVEGILVGVTRKYGVIMTVCWMNNKRLGLRGSGTTQWRHHFKNPDPQGPFATERFLMPLSTPGQWCAARASGAAPGAASGGLDSDLKAASDVLGGVSPWESDKNTCEPILNSPEGGGTGRTRLDPTQLWLSTFRQECESNSLLILRASTLEKGWDGSSLESRFAFRSRVSGGGGRPPRVLIPSRTNCGSATRMEIPGADSRNRQEVVLSGFGKSWKSMERTQSGSTQKKVGCGQLNAMPMQASCPASALTGGRQCAEMCAAPATTKGSSVALSSQIHHGMDGGIILVG
ncbi:hypothetical protein THAOC_02970, partial [Thalassiosira oceanica]